MTAKIVQIIEEEVLIPDASGISHSIAMFTPYHTAHELTARSVEAAASTAESGASARIVEALACTSTYKQQNHELTAVS